MELWDLVSAFGRIIRENVAAKPSNIVYDDTPIHVHMSRILAQLNERGRLALSELLDARLHKSVLIGMFLAVLELVRHHRVRAEQNDLFGEIWILPGADARTDPPDRQLRATSGNRYRRRPPSRIQRTAPAMVLLISRISMPWSITCP